MNFNEQQYLAQTAAASGLFPQISGNPAAAFMLIQRALELGVSPTLGLTEIAVGGQGKFALSAGLTAGLVLASGKYTFTVRVRKNDQCIIDWYEGEKKLGESAFTFADAERAGLAGKSVWKQYPSSMLFARALTSGARTYCQDVFMGSVYTPEELGFEVDEENRPLIQKVPSVAEFVPTTSTAGENAVKEITLKQQIKAIGTEVFGNSWAKIAQKFVNNYLGVEKSPKDVTDEELKDVLAHLTSLKAMQEKGFSVKQERWAEFLQELLTAFSYEGLWQFTAEDIEGVNEILDDGGNDE